MIETILAIPAAELFHHFTMAREIKGHPVAAPPFSNDPRKYVENPFGFDMTASMVRDQRMSGVFAALWGNASGQV